LRRIAELTSDEYRVWISADYCELRDLVLSRLTLFNARRGGEPARLTLSGKKQSTGNGLILLPSNSGCFGNSKLHTKPEKGTTTLYPFSFRWTHAKA